MESKGEGKYDDDDDAAKSSSTVNDLGPAYGERHLPLHTVNTSTASANLESELVTTIVGEETQEFAIMLEE